MTSLLKRYVLTPVLWALDKTVVRFNIMNILVFFWQKKKKKEKRIDQFFM